MKTLPGLRLACLLRRSKGWRRRPNIPIDEADQRRTDTTRLLTVLLATAIFSSAQIAMAQGPPINTDTPIMLGVQGRGVRTFAKIIRRDTLLSDGNEIDDPLDRRTTIVVTPVVVPYNLFSDKFQVAVIVPFMDVNVHTNTSETSGSGIGDVRLFAKRLLYQHDRRGKTIRVAAKAGIKLPTGDEKGAPALGTGSTDYFFTTVAGWIQGRVGVYGEGIFNLNTSREQVDFGNSVAYNFAFGYRLLPVVYETYPSPQLNAYLELNGTTASRSKVDGRERDNSGGTVLFLSPGIQYVGGRRWLIEGSFQFPIVDRPNGLQLGTAWTASFGARILLF